SRHEPLCGAPAAGRRAAGAAVRGGALDAGGRRVALPSRVRRKRATRRARTRARGGEEGTVSIRRVLTLGLALISVSGADVAAQVSETARRQIRQVEDAVRKLDTPAAALDAGFRPALGWIPAMGEHWVNQGRM